MSLKIIFTWWEKQTFGTFLKTLFFGKYVGSDEKGNKYYQSKKNERWVIYAKNIYLNYYPGFCLLYDASIDTNQK